MCGSDILPIGGNTFLEFTRNGKTNNFFFSSLTSSPPPDAVFSVCIFMVDFLVYSLGECEFFLQHGYLGVCCDKEVFLMFMAEMFI